MADDGVVLDDIAMDETAPDAECNFIFIILIKILFSEDEIRKGVSKRKGRGFEGSQKSNVKEYETLGDDGFYGPQRSVEGWIIFVTNVHEEAQEEDVKDLFKDYGNVLNMHLNLDRRTGYFKGYAIVQFETQKEAADAIAGLNGYDFLGQELSADWCFVKGGRDKRR